MDETWTIFDGVTEDMEAFKKRFIPELHLRPEVHPDVVENFRLVRKLIEHSYFEYKFYDIAALKAVITLEMALSIRYEQLSGQLRKKSDSLQKLLKWFEERHSFEVYYPEYLDAIRSIRNLYAHPTNHSFGGSSIMHIIEKAVDLINELYEDPGLRIKRMELTKNIIAKIESFDHGMVCDTGEKKYWVYRAWPGFVNNKDDQLAIHFYYKPSFEMSDEYLETNDWSWTPTLYFLASQIEIGEDSISMKDEAGKQLLITAITDEEDREVFDNWIKKYGEFSYKTGEFILTEKGITDTFLLHLREFHKI